MILPGGGTRESKYIPSLGLVEKSGTKKDATFRLVQGDTHAFDSLLPQLDWANGKLLIEHGSSAV